MAAAVCCASASVSPALAQPAGAGQKRGTLEEVLVTAQRRSENLQDVPIAVTALGSDELRSANIDAQLSLPKLTPNLTFIVNAAAAAPFLRGIGSQYSNAGLESSVAVYLDDMYLPRASSALLSFNDIERIEVLKGPQGTLYGRNASGGAIRIITPEPAAESEARLGLIYGTDNRLAAEGMVNGELVDGLRMRLALRHDENDGYLDNVVPGYKGRLAHRDETAVLAKLLYEASERLRVRISGDYVRKDDTEGMSFINLNPGAPEQIGAALGGLVGSGFHDIANDVPNIGTDYTGGGVSLRVEFDMGDATLSSITSYRNEERDSFADLDATGFPLQHVRDEQETDMVTQEFQIAGSAGRLTYIAGLYLLDETARHLLGLHGASIDQSFGQPGTQLGGVGEVTTRSIAPFAQLDYELTDKLTLTAGARYTKEKKEIEFSRGFLAQVGPDGVPLAVINAPLGQCVAPGQVLCEAATPESEFEKVTPKLTLSYSPSDSVMVYGSYSRGFKSGGFNLPAFGAVDEVDPEMLDAFEFGWKSQFAGLRFNGAVFYYDYQDLQQQITDQSTGGTRAVNAANAEVYGMEADLTWAPRQQLELGAGIGYTHSEYEDYVGDAYYPCGSPQAAASAGCAAQGGLGFALLPGQDFAGNELVNAPEWSGYVRAAYTVPLGGAGSLALSGVANYRSKSYYDPAGLFEERERTMLSARISWLSPGERYTVALFGENLTDRECDQVKAPQAAGGWRVPGPPRQIYLQATARFQ
jgi:iron complex outermembrane receptor protein